MLILPQELRTAPWRDRSGRVSVLKAVTFILLFYPAAWMAYHWLSGTWMIPQRDLTYWSGLWAIVLLLLSLVVTPLRRVFGWRRLLQVRRMIGIAALTYTVAHIVIWCWLEMFDLHEIIEEMVTRLTLIVATVSFAGLVALAATSFDSAVRRMGAPAWNRLHRLTYAFTGLAVFHFLLSPGASGGRPFLMVGAFFWLMAWRYLDRRGLGRRPSALAGLGLAATLLTVTLEAVWPAVRFGMDPWMSLGFNFSLTLGISPGWKMLGLSMAVALGAAYLQRTRTIPAMR